MDAGSIENLKPEARQERRSSSREDFDPMVQRYRGHHHECPLRLLHIVAMIRMIVRGDNDRRDRDGGRGGREGRGLVHFARDTGTPCLTSSITHLTCNCGGADVNSTYRQCLVSMRNSTTYFNALTLFDTGAYTSFVNREVAKWLELQQHGGAVAGAHLARSSRHDVTTFEVGLAGTQLSS